MMSLKLLKIINYFLLHLRRHGGLVVSSLDSGSNGPGSGTGWGSTLCS